LVIIISEFLFYRIATPLVKLSDENCCHHDCCDYDCNMMHCVLFVFIYLFLLSCHIILLLLVLTSLDLVVFAGNVCKDFLGLHHRDDLDCRIHSNTIYHCLECLLTAKANAGAWSLVPKPKGTFE
jgi:hypothetical protein